MKFGGCSLSRGSRPNSPSRSAAYKGGCNTYLYHQVGCAQGGLGVKGVQPYHQVGKGSARPFNSVDGMMRLSLAQNSVAALSRQVRGVE